MCNGKLAICLQEHLIPGAYKFDALITTFEMVLSDCPELREIAWRCVIIDEAHRLKNRNCKLLDSLKMLDLVCWLQQNVYLKRLNLSIKVLQLKRLLSDLILLCSSLLSSLSISTFLCVLCGFSQEHKVLLTGTPLQNTVEELFSLLHFLEPAQFPSETEFLRDFGDLKTEEQVLILALTIDICRHIHQSVVLKSM